MLHPRLGDDPQWVLSHARERLELTDPPTATTPRPHARHARPWAAALAAMLALTATVHADTEPTAPRREPITTTPAAHPVQPPARFHTPRRTAAAPRDRA